MNNPFKIVTNFLSGGLASAEVELLHKILDEQVEANKRAQCFESKIDEHTAELKDHRLQLKKLAEDKPTVKQLVKRVLSELEKKERPKRQSRTTRELGEDTRNWLLREIAKPDRRRPN